MRASFTASEKKLLQGQANKLAFKHNCTKTYVNYIISGEREVNSELSKRLHQDMKSLIELLTPDNPESDQNQQ